MILNSRFAPRASTRSMFAVGLLALLVLLTFVQTITTQVRAGSADEAPATPAGKSESPATSDFPYVVKFEQGATRFATDATNGTGESQKIQTIVNKGHGEFMLGLPMPCRGLPHVSFYAGGSSIGGNYFGTGDSVMKRWWGADERQ